MSGKEVVKRKCIGFQMAAAYGLYSVFLSKERRIRTVPKSGFLSCESGAGKQIPVPCTYGRGNTRP